MNRRSLMKKWRELPHPMLLVIGLLVCFGMAMMVSASGGKFHPWFMSQLPKAILGIIAMFALAFMPARLTLRFAYIFYFLCVGLLILVEAMGFIGMGAQRWVSLGFFNLQPSELAKIALILALARYYHLARPENISHPLMLAMPIGMIALPMGLILIQPNLGTATITGLVGFTMLFMAGVSWWYFAALVGSVMAAAPIGWHFLHDYQKRRVMTFLDPSQDPLGAGYNITQSIIAIGSGGFFGKGFIQGSQGQLDFLPEKQTDFIFTMVAEEFGFLGSLFLLLCYAAILFFGLVLAVKARNKFSSMIASGVVAMMFAHIFINMAMVMGLVPVVGVPLPLLSYGGSFLISTLLALGLLLHAYRHRDVRTSGGLF